MNQLQSQSVCECASNSATIECNNSNQFNLFKLFSNCASFSISFALTHAHTLTLIHTHMSLHSHDTPPPLCPLLRLWPQLTPLEHAGYLTLEAN